MKLTYTKTVLLSKLHDELLAAGVVVAGRDRVEGKPDDTGVTCSEVYITIPDDAPKEIIDQIETVVNAHDPTLPPPPLQSIKITTDKIEIIADGVDTATITVTLEPAGTGITTIDVLVDGSPVAEVDVVDDVATFEFTATDPGKYMIEVISGEVRNHIFIKAV